MTDNYDTNDDQNDRQGGITGALRSFISMLADMEEKGENNRIGSGRRKSMDYSYSVHIGSGRPVERGHLNAERNSDQKSGTWRRNVALDSRHDGADTIVVADLPGAEPASVTATLADDYLYVKVDDDLVGRVQFDRDDLGIVDEHFANGVLMVRLRPPEVDA